MSIEEMRSRISDSSNTLEVYHELTPKDNTFEWMKKYHERYVSLLRRVTMPVSDRQFLEVAETLIGTPYAVVDFLTENSYYRGYDKSPEGRPIVLHHEFGSNGTISEVTDFGIGFNAGEFMKAANQRRLVYGVHFQDNGKALNTLSKPEYKAWIESRPGKTTVRFMYLYQF